MFGRVGRGWDDHSSAQGPPREAQLRLLRSCLAPVPPRLPAPLKNGMPRAVQSVAQSRPSEGRACTAALPGGVNFIWG